jgi:hypothetical protein
MTLCGRGPISAARMDSAAPLVVRLTADPSLRGALVALTDMVQSLKQGEVSLQDIETLRTFKMDRTVATATAKGADV